MSRHKILGEIKDRERKIHIYKKRKKERKEKGREMERIEG